MCCSQKGELVNRSWELKGQVAKHWVVQTFLSVSTMDHYVPYKLLANWL